MVIKLLGIIKGDIRYDYLSLMIDNVVLSDKLIEFYNIDKLLLPINGINDNYEIKGTNINLLDIIKQNSIKTIYVGNSSKRLEELCNNNSINLIEFLNGDLIISNALLTCKGIIHYLGYDICDISDYRILIVGYGNIGYYLSKFFDLYGVNYSVLTQNELEVKYLKLENKKVEENLSGFGYDIIINTIPHNLNWNYETLTNSKIIDIASTPYGFDINKINENKINYYIYSAIPSKYAPMSAARLIKNKLNLS